MNTSDIPVEMTLADGTKINTRWTGEYVHSDEGYAPVVKFNSSVKSSIVSVVFNSVSYSITDPRVMSAGIVNQRVALPGITEAEQMIAASVAEEAARISAAASKVPVPATA